MFVPKEGAITDAIPSSMARRRDDLGRHMSRGISIPSSRKSMAWILSVFARDAIATANVGAADEIESHVRTMNRVSESRAMHVIDPVRNAGVERRCAPKLRYRLVRSLP